MFTWTVPSSFGSARMSRAAISNHMSRSEPLGGDHIPEQVDHLLAPGRDLHLGQRG